MTRRYRRPPLSADAKEAYSRVHYCYSTKDYTERVLDIYDYCHDTSQPFILILQPRTYCKLELSLTTTNTRLTPSGEESMQRLAQWYLDLSPARSDSKSVTVYADGAMITGLDFESAKQLAVSIWEFVQRKEGENHVL